MQFVELVVSTEQALMTRAALDLVLQDKERYVMTDEEREQYERLAVFYGHAAVNPGNFPLSPKQASRLKSIVRKAKGPAQPVSRRNKRKARQERRQGFHKRRRKELKEFREEYNVAMAKLRAEEAEAEAAYAEIAARVEAEPKFDIVDGQGKLIMSGVPQSAIVATAEPGEMLAFDPPSTIVLPDQLPQE